MPPRPTSAINMAADPKDPVAQKNVCKTNIMCHAVSIKYCLIHAIGKSVLSSVTLVLNIHSGRGRNYFRIYDKWAHKSSLS